MFESFNPKRHCGCSILNDSLGVTEISVVVVSQFARLVMLYVLIIASELRSFQA